MKKKIKLSEEKFKKIFKNNLNEITFGDIENAQNRSYELFGFLKYKISSISDSIDKAIDTLNEFDTEFSTCYSKGANFNEIGYMTQNPYIKKIDALANQLRERLSSAEDVASEIQGILDRKDAQKDNFDQEMNNIDYDKFYADNDDQDVTNDIEDKEMDYLRKNYSKA